MDELTLASFVVSHPTDSLFAACFCLNVIGHRKYEGLGVNAIALL